MRPSPTDVAQPDGEDGHDDDEPSEGQTEPDARSGTLNRPKKMITLRRFPLPRSTRRSSLRRIRTGWHARFPIPTLLLCRS
jgi:hypothetical protein